MTTRALSALPADVSEALAQLRAASNEAPVFVFKKSPICPVSTMAEHEFREYLGQGPAIQYAFIDVIKERPLARGLTSALDIQHESPQALLFHRGQVAWHASHGDLTQTAFEQAKAALAGA